MYFDITQFFLFIFLIVSLTPAQAEWEKITENNNLINYIDKSTIKKTVTLEKFGD